MPLSSPLRGDPWLNELVQMFNAHNDENQRAFILGWKTTAAGADVALRFLASRATQYVRVHVQSTAANKGGATYNAAQFESSDEIDCRENRQQDRVIARDGASRYYVWLIPVFDFDGTKIKFNGAEEADHMAFADLGV